MTENDFLPFASGGAANVVSQATYAALTALTDGFQSGIANSDEFNKVWRQSSIIAAVVAQAIVDITGQAAIDDGTTATLLANFKSMLQSGTVASTILPLTASVASNALTITLNPTILDIRDATLGSGTVNTRNIASALSLTISDGSTLGTVSGEDSYIAVLVADNAGALQLCAVNLDCGFALDETALISTTAEGGAGAADSATTIYSTTALSAVPYRLVGILKVNEATAGTWGTAPSLIQGAGGEAFAAMASLGYGQTWQNVASSRAFLTTYYNTTGKPIEVSITLSTSGSTYLQLIVKVNSITVQDINNDVGNSGNQTANVAFIVPPGASYVVSETNATITEWAELR